MKGFSWFSGVSYGNCGKSTKTLIMKKILLFVVGSALSMVLYSQTLTDLLKNKSVFATSDFMKYIQPYLPTTMPNSSSITITPKIYTVKSDMVFDDLLTTYHVKALNLESSASIIFSSFMAGTFNGITPKKGVQNIVLVSVPNGDGSYALRWVILLFSEKVQKWIVNGGPMDHKTLFKKDALIASY